MFDVYFPDCCSVLGIKAEVYPCCLHGLSVKSEILPKKDGSDGVKHGFIRHLSGLCPVPLILI